MSLISVDLFVTDSTTSSVTKEKYEIVKKQLKEEKDPNIVFQEFCIFKKIKAHIKLDHIKYFPKNEW